MSETCGGVIDKLITTNIKLFKVQDALHRAAEQGLPLDSENTGMMVALNLQRNRLMSELDELVDEAVKQGRAEIDPRIKIV